MTTAIAKDYSKIVINLDDETAEIIAETDDEDVILETIKDELNGFDGELLESRCDAYYYIVSGYSGSFVVYKTYVDDDEKMIILEKEEEYTKTYLELRKLVNRKFEPYFDRRGDRTWCVSMDCRNYTASEEDMVEAREDLQSLVSDHPLRPKIGFAGRSGGHLVIRELSLRGRSADNGGGVAVSLDPGDDMTNALVNATFIEDIADLLSLIQNISDNVQNFVNTSYEDIWE